VQNIALRYFARAQNIALRYFARVQNIARLDQQQRIVRVVD
jgi:hypothetical protein